MVLFFHFQQSSSGDSPIPLWLTWPLFMNLATSRPQKRQHVKFVCIDSSGADLGLGK